MTTIIFDTETTGLIKPNEVDIKKQPSIIEIYCRKLDDNLDEIGNFAALILPPAPVSDEITRITGIDNNLLKNKPTFGEIFPHLASFFIGVDTIVAHNLAFDRSMLANEIVRINKLLYFPWPVKHICTVEKTLHIEQRRMNLSNLYKHLFGEEFKDAHRAKNDVDALTKCYKKLVMDGVI